MSRMTRVVDRLRGRLDPNREGDGKDLGGRWTDHIPSERVGVLTIVVSCLLTQHPPERKHNILHSP